MSYDIIHLSPAGGRVAYFLGSNVPPEGTLCTGKAQWGATFAVEAVRFPTRKAYLVDIRTGEIAHYDEATEWFDWLGIFVPVPKNHRLRDLFDLARRASRALDIADMQGLYTGFEP